MLRHKIPSDQGAMLAQNGTRIKEHLRVALKEQLGVLISKETNSSCN